MLPGSCRLLENLPTLANLTRVRYTCQGAGSANGEEAESARDDPTRRLAAALEADEDELLVLAKKVPPVIRERVFERPEAFGKLARLDDETLDLLIAQIDQPDPERKGHRTKTRG